MGTVHVTGIERMMRDDQIIVSKTDIKGRITYCNDVFIEIGGYSEPELIGKPHNIVRHPHMPRSVFHLLWETIASGHEMFAYVVNRAKNGDHYWVFAHVTPDTDDDGKVVGYHSFRRAPERKALETIIPLYKQLLAIEERHGDRKAGITAAVEKLNLILSEKGVTYDQFVLGL